MVLLVLSIKAELENVASIRLPIGYHYCLTVKNSVGEDVREGVYASSSETHDLSGSRGTANFVLKWERDSKKEAQLNVVDVKGVTRPYTADDDGKFVPIIGFECRGMEPIDWHPEDGFIVQSTGGKVFEDVDLSDREWAEFDDEANLSVGILELQWKFEVRR